MKQGKREYPVIRHLMYEQFHGVRRDNSKINRGVNFSVARNETRNHRWDNSSREGRKDFVVRFAVHRHHHLYAPPRKTW